MFFSIYFTCGSYFWTPQRSYQSSREKRREREKCSQHHQKRLHEVRHPEARTLFFVVHRLMFEVLAALMPGQNILSRCYDGMFVMHKSACLVAVTDAAAYTTSLTALLYSTNLGKASFAHFACACMCVNLQRNRPGSGHLVCYIFLFWLFATVVATA